MFKNVYLIFLNFILILSTACNSSLSSESVVVDDEPKPYMLVQYNQEQKPLFNIQYEYDNDGQIVKEIQVDSTQNPVMVREKHYSYNDTLLQQIKVLANNEYDYETNYEYNSENRLIKQEIKDNDDVRSSTSYKYDDRGNAIEQLNFTNGGGTTKMEFIYNENDKLVEGKSFDVSNKIIKWNKNVFVEDTLREIFFLSATGDTTHHLVYDYVDGRRVKEKELSKDGNTYIIKEYSYGPHGKVIGEKASRYQDHRIEYVRDEAGNLQEEKLYDKYGQLLRVIYYK